ncbi:MAG: cytochrome b N-terminal domain-containing protein [Anaerolineae bacterium]|nr:cytochrome b N-terminal domain-containing protein [Anaerolineae bacterium]
MRSLPLRSWKERLLYTPQAEPETRSRIRAVTDSLILHVHPAKVPVSALRFTYTWALGGISATLALLLLVTGVLLMFRYEPTIERAYTSIQQLETQVVFGSLVRAIHHWSANLLVLTTFLHLLRVFLTGGYKKGRAVNWLIGIGLMLLVLLFNFTGYLLPWDQLAYWAITVSTSLISYVPVIGPTISRVALAGPEVGQGALSNFYALHVAVLPVMTTAALGYHFWRVRKDGGISRPEREEGRAERVTTMPHLVRRELAVAAAVIAAIVIWGMLQPAPLAELANPTRSPNPAKAAWFFVGLQELLLHMDTLAAMALIVLVLGGMVILPRWDRHEENIGIYFRSPAGRRSALLGALLSIDLVPLLVFADEAWIDLPAMFPAWPTLVSNGLIPLAGALIGLAAVYAIPRKVFKANHSEALVGLFSFLMASLVVLTIIGNIFRGPNMALVLPF